MLQTLSLFGLCFAFSHLIGESTAYAIKERAVCNADNVLRALRNPTRSVAASTFCSEYLRPTSASTATATETAISTVGVASDNPTDTVTIGRTTVTTSIGSTTVTETTTTLSTVTTTIPTTATVVQASTATVTSTITTNAQAPDTTIISGVSTVTETAPAPLKKRDVPIPDYLATVPGSRISSACSCFVTPLPPAATSISTVTTTISTTVMVTGPASNTDFTTTTITEVETVLTTTTKSDTTTTTVFSTSTVTDTSLTTTTAIFTQTNGATVTVTNPALNTIYKPSTTVTTTITPPAQGGAAKCAQLPNGDNLVYDFVTVNYHYTQQTYQVANTPSKDCCARCYNTPNCVNFSYNFNDNGKCLLNIATDNMNAIEGSPNAQCPNGRQNVSGQDAAYPYVISGDNPELTTKLLTVPTYDPTFVPLLSASIMQRPSAVEAITASVPPKSEPYTFLTILESHLSHEVLPTLHDILQDPKLTADIGWDLIHLLVPLLPQSHDCLDVVARLGNPREVVLKVSEALREIDFNDENDDEDDLYGDGRDELRTAASISDSSKPVQAAGPGGSNEIPRRKSTLQCQTLISLLPTLHQRLKTTYPSRFLASTCKAVLPTYNDAAKYLPAPDLEMITSEIVRFIKTLAGKRRPHLPPRKSTQDIKPVLASAPDPEGQDEDPPKEEMAFQTRLLQSFCTHVLEDLITSLSAEDVPGLAWSARFYEKIHPKKIVPHRDTFAQRFTNESYLQARETSVGQVVAIAIDLSLRSEELVDALIKPEVEPEEDTENELPSSPSDIPLSRSGSLFLLLSRISSQLLFGSSVSLPSLRIFPHHATIIGNLIGSDENGGMSTIGTEAEPLIDAVIALGLWSVHNGGVTDLDNVNEEEYKEYVQKLSLLSANTPSPTLRYQAHLLCASVLHAHPSEMLRLSIIRDTLEHCPFENLKASAVGWFKDETLTANHQQAPDDKDAANSIFATPAALDSISHDLFPTMTHSLDPASHPNAWETLKANFTFYLAALNLYYLLCTAPLLRDNLGVEMVHANNDIHHSFLDPLRQASVRFKKELTEGSLAKTEGEAGALAGVTDLQILDDALDRVTNAVEALEG
ncbi:MAG: hypothetical protein M1833_007323 [Piccolia ochrophora]|nr:MAG: hypothetical protein M1833_007323 [Piccolia ochrophora]